MSFFKNISITKPQCTKCKMDKGCKTPRMPLIGEGKKEILIISGAPSEGEDKVGKPSLGILKEELIPLGINVNKDTWVINSVNCYTEKPKPTQADTCRPYVLNVIKQRKPKKIFLLGELALQSFYGHRNTKLTSIFKMNGLKFWDSTHNAWVFPLWHPEEVSSRKFDYLMKAEYARCIKRAVHHTSEPLKKEWLPHSPIQNFNKAEELLTYVLHNETLIAIDYETTGLDMFKSGHSTVSFSWATDKGAWAVPVEHPVFTSKQQQIIKGLISKILAKRKIKKIVQGINFEYPWTKKQIGCEPRSFFYDTQLATHVLDNRTGITGLKFQCFMRWGIEDYDNLSKQYIKNNPDTEYNDMLKMPLDALLQYNALDALYTYALYLEQLEEFTGNELKAYNFFHKGAIALCEMSYNGISIRTDYYLQQRAILEGERADLERAINESEEARMYTKKFGGKFDYNSPKDLQVMLFNVLGLQPIKQTKTGDSVDEVVLTKLDIELTKNIIAVRKLNKMIGTYVDGFLTHTHDGEMHPSFSLARARSHRSSSQNPNFQNVPKRDPKAKRITRSGMVPRPGRVLGEMDFEGAEISTGCFYHKDPTFIAYQLDPEKGDMHRDACAFILKINSDEVPKDARQATKGIWTFSQFYGSYYVSCAKQGWEEYPQIIDKEGNLVLINGVPIDKHIKKVFKNYTDFENHLKKFENKFWNEWFPVYTAWKKDVVKGYERDGFVETFLGFRFKGYMDRKQCTNYPIQGTSFHLLLYTAYKVIAEIKKRGLQTLVVAQIHDSLILDIPIEEIEIIKEMLSRIVGTLHEVFTWMDFPMGLDLELSKSYELGGSFANMEKCQL